MPYRKVEQPLEREVVYRLYVDEGMSLSEVGATLGVSPDTIRYALQKWGIPRRTRSQAISIQIKRGRKWKHRKGEQSANWKGGRRIASNGYSQIRIPDHSRANKNGYVFEHIIVWEQHHGEVPLGWHIHHINGTKHDNRIENLKAMPSREHMRYIATQQEIIRVYEEKIARLQKRVEELEAELAKRGG